MKKKNRVLVEFLKYLNLDCKSKRYHRVTNFFSVFLYCNKP